jgi:hypothetical protein
MTQVRNFCCGVVALIFAVLAAGMAVATAAYAFNATYELLFTTDSPAWSIARSVGCLVLTLALWVLAHLNEFEYSARPAPRHRTRKA